MPLPPLSRSPCILRLHRSLLHLRLPLLLRLQRRRLRRSRPNLQHLLLSQLQFQRFPRQHRRRLQLPRLLSSLPAPHLRLLPLSLRPLRVRLLLRLQQAPLLHVLRRSNLFVPRRNLASRLASGRLVHRPRVRLNGPVRSRKLQDPGQRKVRRARSNLFVLCPRAIADRFPALRREIATAGPVDRVQVNPCARKGLADKADVHSRHAPEGREVREASGLLVNVLVQFLRALALVRVCRAARACFPRCRTKCRPRRNPESLFTHASRSSASVRWRTSGRWKASANCTRRVSARGPAPVVLPLLRLLRRNRVLRATSP